mgnify:CR=1 FL=1
MVAFFIHDFSEMKVEIMRDSEKKQEIKRVLMI